MSRECGDESEQERSRTGGGVGRRERRPRAWGGDGVGEVSQRTITRKI